MADQLALDRVEFVRGPGDPRVRYHYQRRAQHATNRAGAARVRATLERIGRD